MGKIIIVRKATCVMAMRHLMLRQEHLSRDFLMEFYILQLPKHQGHFDELNIKCPPPLAHVSNA